MKDFYAYIENQYVPSNMVLSIAGNVSPHEVFDLAAKYLGNMKPSSKKQGVLPPIYQGGILTKLKEDLSQVQFVMGFESIPFVDEKYYIASVSSAILGRGMSSRLFQEIREKHGLCYTIACMYEAQKEAGMFTIYCGTSPKDVEKLEEATIIELQKATRDITQKELGKVLEQYKSSILFGNESTSSRAQKGIANLFAFNRYIPADEIIQGVEKISIDEIQSFIKETTAGEITKVVYGNV